MFNKIFLYSVLIVLACGSISCKKLLPDSLDNLGADTRFTLTTYAPTLGRNTLMSNNFTAGNATLPLTMKIVNMRHADGSPAPELTNTYPVKVWTKAYDGTEKSLSEIESKRSIQNLPLFQIREHAGNFLMWDVANSSFVQATPSAGYIFDVEISNSGGLRYARNMLLVPQRERPFEPSVYDPVNGIATNSFVNPLTMSNVKGQRSKFELNLKDVQIYFYKNTAPTTDSSNTLTFRFYDSTYTPIDPAKFNLTNWPGLVHGFNIEQTIQYVRYKVAYPIPLINYVTNYTNLAGTQCPYGFWICKNWEWRHYVKKLIYHLTFRSTRKAIGRSFSFSRANHQGLKITDNCKQN